METFKTEATGSGWKIAPQTTARAFSRNLHLTPEDAISSMKYMTKREAVAVLALNTEENNV